MRPAGALFGALAFASGCELGDIQATIHYNFQGLEPPQVGLHYQHFAEVDGLVVDLGCFVVERRQVNCFDARADGTPVIRPAVVECACPCTAVEDNPCQTGATVVAGAIRGVVDHSEAAVRAGGVEFPSYTALAESTEVFITREPAADASPQPTSDLLLRGDLRRDGGVLRGELATPTPLAISGQIAIVPVRDGAWL
jgi:hypothetical protein